MFALLFGIALAQVPSIDTVDPVVTRAGFLRFDDDRFISTEGLEAIRKRLVESDEARERAALAEWFARTARRIDAADSAVELALQTPHAEVRRTLVEALVRGPEQVLRPLHALASDADPSVRTAVLEVVARSQAPDREQRLRSALGDADPAVRTQALLQLRATGIQADVAGLLTDPSAFVRTQAALYLKRHQPETFVSFRQVLRSDPDSRVRALAE